MFVLFVFSCDVFSNSPTFDINDLKKKLEDIFGALTINHSKHISAVHFHSPPSYFSDGGVREQRQGS